MFFGEHRATIGINRATGVIDVHHEFAIGGGDCHPFPVIDINRTIKIGKRAILTGYSVACVVMPGIPLNAALKSLQRGVYKLDVSFQTIRQKHFGSSCERKRCPARIIIACSVRNDDANVPGHPWLMVGW